MTEENKHPSFSFLNRKNKWTEFFSSFGFLKKKQVDNPESVKQAEDEQKKENPPKEHIIRLVLLNMGFTLAISVTLYFLSSYSRVGELSVVGANEIVVQDVIDASTVKSGESLWETYFDKVEIEKSIKEKLPQIREVYLSLDGLNDFVFQVEEYKTVAYLFETQEYYKILENGKVLEQKETVARGGLPVISSFEEGAVLNRFIDEYSKLEESLHKSISEVQYDPSETDTYRIRLYMNDGNQVIASIPTFSNRMQYYPVMKNETGEIKGVFNMQAGAYFTPYDAADLSEESNEDE